MDISLTLPLMSSRKYQRAGPVTSQKHPLAIVQNIDSDDEDPETKPNSSSAPVNSADSDSDSQSSDSDIASYESMLSPLLHSKDSSYFEVDSEALLHALEDPNVISSMTLPELDTVLQALEEYRAVIKELRYTDQDSDSESIHMNFSEPMHDGKLAESNNTGNPPIDGQAMEESISRRYRMTKSFGAAKSRPQEDIIENRTIREAVGRNTVIQTPAVKDQINTKCNQVLAEQATTDIVNVGEDRPGADMLKWAASETLADMMALGKSSPPLGKSTPRGISKNITIPSAKDFHCPWRPKGSFQDYICSSLATSLEKVQWIVNGMADFIR